MVMKTYLYDAEYAKENGARLSFLKLFLICFLSIMVICVGIIVSIFAFDEGTYPIPLALLWFIAFVAVIVYTVKEGQLYLAASQTGYVVDEEGVTWLVQLINEVKHGFGGVTDVYAAVSNIRSAQKTQQRAKKEEVLIEYVEGTKAGHKYWNFFTGGEAKVMRLRYMSVTDEKKKYYVCSYEDEKGNTKKIKIVKAFPEFIKG